MLIAIFAYVVAPDNTPYANNMVIELGARKAGFKKQILLLPKDIIQQKQSRLSGWFNGINSNFKSIPINSYRFNDKGIIVAHYIDDGLADTLQFSFQQLLPQDQKMLMGNAAQEYIVTQQIVSKTYLLGTDKYGRDILSRLLVGTRVSIAVGLVAVILSLTIGIILGSLAGYYGGRVDDAVMWIINILWPSPPCYSCLPSHLLLAKAFGRYLSPSGLLCG